MTETTSTDLVQRTPQQELIATVRGDGFRAQIEAALPGNVTVRRFERAAITALMTNPDLANEDVDKPSLFQSLIRCAQDGLLPDGKEAALVVFSGRDGKKAQYMPMVSGFRKIAAEAGWAIISRVVYANDRFEYEEGLEPKLTHVPAVAGERGDLFAAYAIARKTGEQPILRVLYKPDVEKRRGVSRTKDRGPWVEWPAQMWEKTVARDIFAELPLGDRDLVTRVLEASDFADTPAEAATLLYGGEEHPPARGIEPQQAAVTDPETPSPPVTAVPGDQPFDTEPPEDGQLSEVGQLARDAASAGEMLVTSGRHKDMTVRQVAELGNPGLNYLLWMIDGGWKEAKLRGGVELYLRVLHPDTYSQRKGQ